MTKREDRNAELDAFDDSPPSEEEIRASDRLREGLAGAAQLDDAQVVLARAIKLAHSPSELEDREHRAIVERATRTSAAKKMRARVVPIFAIAGALSLAAAVMFMIRGTSPMQSAEAPSSATRLNLPGTPLAQSRSTAPLFVQDEESAKGEETKTSQRSTASSRIDRIAMARENDFRENQFAMWGVR
jgi:hypothetical protein